MEEAVSNPGISNVKRLIPDPIFEHTETEQNADGIHLDKKYRSESTGNLSFQTFHGRSTKLTMGPNIRIISMWL